MWGRRARTRSSSWISLCCARRILWSHWEPCSGGGDGAARQTLRTVAGSERMARRQGWPEALRARWRHRRGQALVEHMLILAVVAVAVVGVLGTLGHNANNVLNTVANDIR